MLLCLSVVCCCCLAFLSISLSDYSCSLLQYSSEQFTGILMLYVYIVDVRG